jgi:hypothetical protein
MRTFRCVCENVLFFDNSLCLACGREAGFCPACRNLVALLPEGGRFRCGNAACSAALVKCANYRDHNVCNRCAASGDPAAALLCDCCRFNQTIPDLSVAGNAEKWYRLEAAKRRLFYDLDLLQLPYGTAADGVQPPLRFDFKADVIPKDEFWRRVGPAERVYTGHANGTITINVREADDVEREKLRVDLGEAHRTLIGHFRHEIGHYYWDALVRGRCEAECKAVFGDHDDPPYADALARYYRDGPPAGWAASYVSAYAAMHPWEDFAETFATYLDMVSALDTAFHVGLAGLPAPLGDLGAMARRYQMLGVALNEMSRTMGLIDFVPEVLVGPVLEKMRFIHNLAGARRPPA